MQYQVYLKHSGNNYSLSTPLPTGGCPDPSNKGSGIVLLDRDEPTAVAKEETSDLRFPTNESTRLHNSSELGLLVPIEPRVLSKELRLGERDR